MADFIGLLASMMSFILFLPAAKKVWENRNDPHALKGASVGMNLLIVLNALLWALYGFLTHAFWVAAPGIVNLPLALFSVYLILKGRKAKVKEPVGREWDEDARVFITAPPGFGSIMKPNEANIRYGVLFHTDEELEAIRRIHMPTRYK